MVERERDVAGLRDGELAVADDGSRRNSPDAENRDLGVIDYRRLQEAAQRSRVRRVQRVRKQGSLRFTFLALSIIVTAVIVTIVMFETLAMLAG